MQHSKCANCPRHQEISRTSLLQTLKPSVKNYVLTRQKSIHAATCNSSALQSVKSSSVVNHLSPSINRNQSRGQGQENITNRSSFHSSALHAITEKDQHTSSTTLCPTDLSERERNQEKNNWGRVMNEQERGCD